MNYSFLFSFIKIKMNNSLKKSLKLRSLKLKNKRTKKSKKNLRKMRGGHKVQHDIAVYYNGYDFEFTTDDPRLKVFDDGKGNYEMTCEVCEEVAPLEKDTPESSTATIDHKKECIFNKIDRNTRKIMSKSNKDLKYNSKPQTEPTSPRTKERMRSERIARRASKRASQRASLNGIN